MWTESARRSEEAIRAAKRPPLAPGDPGEPVISGELSRVVDESLGGATPLAASVAIMIWGLARAPFEGSLGEVALLVGVVGLVGSVVTWFDLRNGMQFGSVLPWPEDARPASALTAAGRGSLPFLATALLSVNFAFSDSFDWAWRTVWLTTVVLLAALQLSVTWRALRAERRLGVRIYAERTTRRAGWKRPPVVGLRP